MSESVTPEYIDALQAENERLRAAIRTFLSHVPLDENAASLLGVPIGPLAAALQEEDTE